MANYVCMYVIYEIKLSLEYQKICLRILIIETVMLGDSERNIETLEVYPDMDF